MAVAQRQSTGLWNQLRGFDSHRSPHIRGVGKRTKPPALGAGNRESESHRPDHFSGGILHAEERFARLRAELYRLVDFWERLAGHPKQPPLPRKVIKDLARELRKVLDRHSDVSI